MNQHTRNIIVDSLILVAFSSILGGISLVVSKSFSGDPNPALDLITVMKKAEAKEVNASSEQEEQEARVKGMKEFDQTLEEGEQLAAKEGKAFVNMTDPHGRTPVMWVCYANYNNIETTLKLEAKRAPYLGRLLEDPRVEIDQKDKDGWTALHWASWSGLDRLSDMLIEKKADINNREGQRLYAADAGGHARQLPGGGPAAGKRGGHECRQQIRQERPSTGGGRGPCLPIQL